MRKNNSHKPWNLYSAQHCERANSMRTRRRRQIFVSMQPMKDSRSTFRINTGSFIVCRDDHKQLKLQMHNVLNDRMAFVFSFFLLMAICYWLQIILCAWISRAHLHFDPVVWCNKSALPACAHQLRSFAIVCN